MGWHRRREDKVRSGWSPLPRCGPSNKVMFPSQQAAEERLARMPVTGWRVYDCGHCRSWHLTSNGTGGQRRPEPTAST